MQPKIDLLTLVYNGQRFIDRYFDALKNLNYPTEALRVHILDNASDDNSYQYIQEKYLNNPALPFTVFLEQNTENLGFAGGNNLLFEKLVNNDADFFFLLNQDGALQPDCLQELITMTNQSSKIGLLEAIQSPNAHPKWYDPETFETSWCSGGGLLIRKAALKEVGFFDHNFFMYCEDVDLSWRMWLKNWQCKVCPKAVYEHITEDLDQEKDQSIRYYYWFRNSFLLHFKYDSLLGILKHYLLAALLCLKQKPIKMVPFLKGYLFAQIFIPFYLLKRVLKPISSRSAWISFNKFEFGKILKKN